jgi:porphobilinogen synthase
MVKAAGALGYLDVAAVAMEQTLAIKRAGADLICTYFAADLAEALQ